MARIFRRHDEAGAPVEALPGVGRRTLVHGERMLMTEFLLSGGRELPEHSHPHEQAGYLVKGHIVLRIGGVEHDTLPGGSWCVPAGVRHGAAIVEDSVALEVFSPVREDYLP